MRGKDEIRRDMRERRRAVSAAERAAASRSVCRQVLERPEIVAALDAHRPIAVYLASKDELDLGDFISEACRRGGVLVAPRWNGTDYEFVALPSSAALVAGPHGIAEPPIGTVVTGVGVVLVPGLAFTKKGGRLGYGGGWYDRLLAKEPLAAKLGVAYGFQVVEDLPRESHDQPINDIIVAERS